jgi:hypothetical protein
MCADLVSSRETDPQLTEYIHIEKFISNTLGSVSFNF